jgi:hypothetical protein
MMGMNPESFTFRMIPLAILAAAILCSPVPALSATETGAAPDHPVEGIPVWWPYHAALMSAGVVILCTGMVVMRLRNRPGRFAAHRLIQTAGAGFLAAGLAVAVYMVMISGAPHLAFIHDQLGAVAFILIVITLGLGYYIFTPRAKPAARKIHPWAGRVAIALAVINIILGISMMGVVLAE